MKTRRSLPNQDLANAAPLNSEEKYNYLWRLKDGYIPYSYKPVRDRVPDVANVEVPGLLPLPKPSWGEIRNKIVRDCYNKEGEAANLQVADGFRLFCQENAVFGSPASFMPFQVGFFDIGLQVSIKFWHDIIISINDLPTIPFIDTRKSGTLTRVGRNFVFSVMHERIRRAFPDFQDVGLSVFQFENVKSGPRSAKLFADDDHELYDYDSLNAMITDTYRMWWMVQNERQKAQRQKPTGTGSLF